MKKNNTKGNYSAEKAIIQQKKNTVYILKLW